MARQQQATTSQQSPTQARDRHLAAALGQPVLHA